ncbi:drug/metabolite transporter (DMT)-like permease [Alkalibaculum bacchi]|uniref:Drug/metabolite transporter (DMT)-like permease n=1 Tax=Alkalibaculum bacchi TaxID=645887 RepID=A0A366I8X4_9FIRM|nr:DMT family transporter [Alkalibaculum bacchi]RBP65976.1 drug/metabolite transporter (DMT)-like permease [Alkalibaculum bacchi]
MGGYNKKVYISVAVYTLIVGLSFMFLKIALESADPIDLLAYRFSAAFIGLFIAYGFRWIKVEFSKERMIKIIPISLFYPLGFFSLQAFALQYISSAEGGILLAASPIFTLILATYFLKERTTIFQKFSILISVIGVMYIAINKGINLEFNNLRGTVLMLLAALSTSSYSVMARKMRKDFSHLEISSIMILIGFIAFNVLSAGKHITNGTLSDFFVPLSNLSFIISIMYLGVLSSLGTSIMNNYILSKIEASKMGVFANLSTIITTIAGAVFLKETIVYYHIIGSVLIIGGVLGVHFSDKK